MHRAFIDRRRTKKKAKFFSKPTNLESVTDAFLKKRDQLLADGQMQNVCFN